MKSTSPKKVVAYTQDENKAVRLFGAEKSRSRYSIVKNMTETNSNTSKKFPGAFPTLRSTSGILSNMTAKIFEIIRAKKNFLLMRENVDRVTVPALLSSIPFKYAWTDSCILSIHVPKTELGGF
mmetsp:Transcript_26583/g.30918  ORF Transcript_26583/g.30918 Transcript_26583/m.30918 type:complete len:124 (+) Transcript_26583:663-1034(+)